MLPAPGEPVREGKLYRRIWPDQSYYRHGKVTSQVFDRKRDDNLSMALAELTTPDEVAAKAPRPGFGVFEIDVQYLLEAGLQVIFDPSEAEGPSHVQVRGNLSGAIRKRLAERARVVLAPVIQE